MQADSLPPELPGNPMLKLFGVPNYFKRWKWKLRWRGAAISLRPNWDVTETALHLTHASLKYIADHAVSSLIPFADPPKALWKECKCPHPAIKPSMH